MLFRSFDESRKYGIISAAERRALRRQNTIPRATARGKLFVNYSVLLRKSPPRGAEKAVSVIVTIAVSAAQVFPRSESDFLRKIVHRSLHYLSVNRLCEVNHKRLPP